MSFCNYREHTCAREGCGQIIVLRADQESRLRQTHANFYCNSGHSNYFPGKTEEEKEIARLEDELAKQRNRTNAAWDAYSDARADGLKCQWPGCRVHSYSDHGSLRRHMQKKHGMPKDREWEDGLDVGVEVTSSIKPTLVRVK